MVLSAGKMEGMKMKKIAIVIAALAAVVSCQKAETVYTGETVQLSFRVSREAQASNTKAVLSGTSVVFEDDDKLSVFDGTSNNLFQTTKGGDEALFTGTAADVAAYLVVSPYNDSYVQMSASVLKYTIPEVQTATPGGVDPNALICAGLATPGSPVTLYNAISLVQVEVPAGLEVKNIQIAGGKGQTIAIAGEFSFNADTKAIAIPDVSKTTTVVTLVPKEGDAYIAPGTYYVAVRPKTTYDAGFTMAYVNASNQLCKRTTATALDIQRGHIVPLGTLNTSDYAAVTGTATLRYYGDAPQFTGRIKVLAGGSGTATATDNVIRKVVFKAHSLYSQAYKTDANLVSNGPASTVQIHAYLSGDVIYVCTEAPVITLYNASNNLFRDFAALEEVEANDIDSQASANFEYMFRNDAKLKKVVFGNADFSKVTNFSYMFYVGASSSLEYVDMGGTATTSATTMQAMFNNDQNLKYLNLGPNFTLAATHTNMFLDTARQTSIDAAGDDAKKCQLYASQAFYDAVRANEATFNPARFLFHAQ